MTLDADQIVDRRRLRRKVSFWRVAAFVFLAIVIVGGVILIRGRDGFPGLAGAEIARVTISGFITDDRDQLALLDDLGKNSSVKAVIVSIDSTGGSTTGGEALYGAIRKLAGLKPTVASVGTFGASAAYMAAIATDHIVARRTSITGSIGVLYEFPEVSKLLDNLGVSMEEIKSAPLKAEPSPFHPASDDAKAVIAGMVKDTYDWFVDIVAERRHLDHATTIGLADGRVFTGNQALAVKLVDEIGGEEQAVAWLAAAKGVDKNLPVRDWKPEHAGGGFLSAQSIVLWFAQQLGIGPDFLRGSVLSRVLPNGHELDGLMSVWQVPAGGEAAPPQGG